MKVLVTGAKGFIGKHMCATLVRSGYEVFEYDITNTQSDLEKYIAEGWVLGLSETTKTNIGKGNSKRCWMIKDGVCKIVSKNEYASYIEKGWKPSSPFKAGILKYMNKNGHYILVHKDDFEKRLSEGWMFGKGEIRGLKGYRWMNNGTEVVLVVKEKIQEYISKGFVFGALNKCKKKGERI